MSDGARQGDGNGDADAAATFARRAQAEHGEAIERLVVFGDAVRGDDRGVHAEVEVLLVLAAEDEAREQRLERLADSVGLEHDVVFTVHVLPADRFESQRDHPLVRTALEEGQSYV